MTVAELATAADTARAAALADARDANRSSAAYARMLRRLARYPHIKVKAPMSPAPPATIEAVVTSVGYADFLAYTLPTNRALFDRIVVATTPEDKATRKLCEYWNVRCVPTSAFTDRGAFCKGAGINEGLAHLDRKGWVLHLDADIVLPPLFRDVVLRAGLDTSCVYGADRMMVRSYEDWASFLGGPPVQQEADIFVHPRPFPIGVRIATSKHGGYLPIGFFQLWHPGTSGVHAYPDQHTDAGRGDMLFAAQWPRGKRGLLPEIIAYHLESAPCDMGTNWEGRKTPRFGPAPKWGPDPVAPLPKPAPKPVDPPPKGYEAAK